MMKCLKCQKEYIPKRMGGLFCKPSHGNAYRQQLKRDAQKKVKLVGQGLAVEKPLTEGERGLWAILSELVEKGRELNTVLNLPFGDVGRDGVGTALAKFVGDCMRAGDKPLVCEVKARIKAEQEVESQIKSKQEKRTAQSNSK